jgi:hypothetical protein
MYRIYLVQGPCMNFFLSSVHIVYEAHCYVLGLSTNVLWEVLLLTPRSRAHLEKQPVVQLLKNFPEFYWTKRFITVFTKTLNCSLSWVRSIQSIPPHLIALKSVLILSSHLRLGLPSGLLISGFPAKILYAFVLSPSRATCLSHPHWLDYSTTLAVIIH